MATATDRWLTDSIATAVPGSNILQVRHVASRSKGNSFYALVSVTTAFTGSVQVEVSPPGAGTWALIGTAMTAPGGQSIQIPADCDLRFNATALSAGGPISCFLELPA